MLKLVFDFFRGWFGRKKKKADLKAFNAGRPVKLIIKTLNEYDLIVYCQKRIYKRETDRWFFPGRTSSYLVFATPVGKVPLDILEVCSGDPLEIFAIQPDFLWDEIQQKLAVKEYLDLLTQRLHEYHKSKKK